MRLAEDAHPILQAGRQVWVVLPSRVSAPKYVLSSRVVLWLIACAHERKERRGGRHYTMRDSAVKTKAVAEPCRPLGEGDAATGASTPPRPTPTVSSAWRLRYWPLTGEDCTELAATEGTVGLQGDQELHQALSASGSTSADIRGGGDCVGDGACEGQHQAIGARPGRGSAGRRE